MVETDDGGGSESLAAKLSLLPPASDSNLVFWLTGKEISFVFSLGLTFEHEFKTTINVGLRL